MVNNFPSYPENVDFRRAVNDPQSCFLDPDLRQCQPIRNPRKQPSSWPGNFAIIFKLESSELRTSWAVRCFTTPPDEQIKKRYELIAQYLEYLDKRQLSYFARFEFLEEGIKVNKQWYPIIKMEWVEGKTLDDYIKDQINSQSFGKINLGFLKASIEEMEKDLKQAKIAHGDLQHENILVTPMQQIKLVDYDEMYVPDLADSPPTMEKGHPSYQHPNRSLQDWGADIDHFSFTVILLSIGALIESPSLWEQFHNDNSLIFAKDDFLNPEQSAILQALKSLNNNEVQKLREHLIEKCTEEDDEQVEDLDIFIVANDEQNEEDLGGLKVDNDEQNEEVESFKNLIALIQSRTPLTITVIVSVAVILLGSVVYFAVKRDEDNQRDVIEPQNFYYAQILPKNKDLE